MILTSTVTRECPLLELGSEERRGTAMQLSLKRMRPRVLQARARRRNGNGKSRPEGSPVKLVVGDRVEKEEILVDEAVLCSSSKYFKRAMSGPWKEAQERTFYLLQESPRAFTRYASWLHDATILVLPGES
jgi:hypothetical protein